MQPCFIAILLPIYFFIHVALTDIWKIYTDMQIFVKSKILMFSNKYFSSEKQPRRTLFAFWFSYVFGNVLITLLRCWRVYQNISVVDIIFRNLVRLLLWIHLQTLFNIFLRDNLFPCSSAWLLLKNIKHARMSFIILSSKACELMIIWQNYPTEVGETNCLLENGFIPPKWCLTSSQVGSHLGGIIFFHVSSFCGTVLPRPDCSFSLESVCFNNYFVKKCN